MIKEPKKKSGTEEIRDNVAELHEVIAYMDFSFERIFSMQEKEYFYAYNVSDTAFSMHLGDNSKLSSISGMSKKSNEISTV